MSMSKVQHLNGEIRRLTKMIKECTKRRDHCLLMLRRSDDDMSIATWLHRQMDYERRRRAIQTEIATLEFDKLCTKIGA